jgi:thiol:disulfide interchange protein DsbD
LNKQTTLSHPDVLREFERQSITLMRADWTRRDPAITRALAELGRSGVPVYVLYQPGQAPLVLPELLSPSMVLQTLKDR